MGARQAGTARGRRRTALLALGALALGARARGAEALTAAVIDLPPWTQRCASGRVGGVMSALFGQLAQFSGVAITVEPLPFARALVLLEQGRATLTVALRTDDMERIALPLATIATEDVIVVGKVGAPWRARADLRGKVVAVLRGAAYPAEVVMDTRVTRYEVVSYAQGVSMLEAGRVDAVLGVRTSLLYALRQHGAAAARFGELFTALTSDFCVFVSRRYHDEAVIARLRTGARQLAERGAFDALRAQSGKAAAPLGC
jgi:polar amino acid transport system substrate-binding protein